jgi:hypothetical protein
MAAGIEIDGKRYKVVESMGFNHDIGRCAKIVKDADRERVAVKESTGWRFWGAADRAQPLIDAIERGWPNDGPSVTGQ